MRLGKDDVYKLFLLGNIDSKISSKERVEILSLPGVHNLHTYLNSQPIKYYKGVSNGLEILTKVTSYEKSYSLESFKVDIDEIEINPKNRSVTLKEEISRRVDQVFSLLGMEEISEADYETVLVNFEKVLNYE